MDRYVVDYVGFTPAKTTRYTDLEIAMLKSVAIEKFKKSREMECIKKKTIQEFKEQYGIVLVQTTTVKAVVTK